MNHKGLCCWYRDKDGVYKCAIKDCNKTLIKNLDEVE